MTKKSNSFSLTQLSKVPRIAIKYMGEIMLKVSIESGGVKRFCSIMIKLLKIKKSFREVYKKMFALD